MSKSETARESKMNGQHGFDLKNASREIRKCAAASGIKSGRWQPVNLNTSIDVQPDDAIVAKVWNTRKSVDVTAGGAVRLTSASNVGQ